MYVVIYYILAIENKLGQLINSFESIEFALRENDGELMLTCLSHQLQYDSCVNTHSLFYM